MFIPRYYESLGHLHVGTQPNRAYYVPASTPMDTVGENRVNSDRFMLLNGDWDFKYYASIYDLDAEVSRLRAAGRPVFYDVDFGGDDAPENADPRTAATGALAADGGWIWVQRSDFSRNGVALCIDTNGSSSWSSNIYGGRFIRNGTAIRLEEMPGDWMTLRVHESAFYDNDTLLDNLCGAEVAFDENCLEQT